MPTFPTFAVRETASRGIMGETSGAPLKPLRDYSALKSCAGLVRISTNMKSIVSETEGVLDERDNL